MAMVYIILISINVIVSISFILFLSILIISGLLSSFIIRVTIYTYEKYIKYKNTDLLNL